MKYENNVKICTNEVSKKVKCRMRKLLNLQNRPWVDQRCYSKIIRDIHDLQKHT